MKNLIQSTKVFVTAKPWLTMALSFVPFAIMCSVVAMVPVNELVISLPSEAMKNAIWFTLAIAMYIVEVPIILAYLNVVKVKAEPPFKRWFPSMQRYEDFLRTGDLS